MDGSDERLKEELARALANMTDEQIERLIAFLLAL